MNGATTKFLRSAITPYPNKVVLDELIGIHGEDNVLNGKIDLWKEVKKIWQSKNAEEKAQWRQALT